MMRKALVCTRYSGVNSEASPGIVERMYRECVVRYKGSVRPSGRLPRLLKGFQKHNLTPHTTDSHAENTENKADRGGCPRGGVRQPTICKHVAGCAVGLAMFYHVRDDRSNCSCTRLCEQNGEGRILIQARPKRLMLLALAIVGCFQASSAPSTHYSHTLVVDRLKKARTQNSWQHLREEAVCVQTGTLPLLAGWAGVERMARARLSHTANS